MAPEAPVIPTTSFIASIRSEHPEPRLGVHEVGLDLRVGLMEHLQEADSVDGPGGSCDPDDELHCVHPIGAPGAPPWSPRGGSRPPGRPHGAPPGSGLRRWPRRLL